MFGDKSLKCPKCKSHNVSIKLVHDTKVRQTNGVGAAGHTYNAARTFMAIGTLGLSNLFLPKAKGKSKVKARTKLVKLFLCRNCGHSWYRNT